MRQTTAKTTNKNDYSLIKVDDPAVKGGANCGDTDEIKAYASSLHQNTMVGDPTADSFTLNNQQPDQ